ncbi:NUDIX hydrolase [Micromonospora sp. NPDC049048]|uniref:NUDIX hydrolase n=1 Tax=Micromonospora sp. NPDC049048 TaxID=3364263 RepID=UPI00371D10F0
MNPAGAAYEIMFDPDVQTLVADNSAAMLRERGKPEEHGDIGVVYEDAFVIALRDAVRFRNGRFGPYIRVLPAHPGTGAAVLPVLADGRLVLVRHFRHELRTWQWEIPRGFAEPGSDGATTAARELEEEVGLQSDKVELLGSLTGDGGRDEVYLARLDARALPETGPAGATEEGIDEFRLVTPMELARMIAAGEVSDCYLLAAFAFATAQGHLGG